MLCYRLLLASLAHIYFSKPFKPTLSVFMWGPQRELNVQIYLGMRAEFSLWRSYSKLANHLSILYLSNYIVYECWEMNGLSHLPCEKNNTWTYPYFSTNVAILSTLSREQVPVFSIDFWVNMLRFVLHLRATIVSWLECCSRKEDALVQISTWLWSLVSDLESSQSSPLNHQSHKTVRGCCYPIKCLTSWWCLYKTIIIIIKVFKVTGNWNAKFYWLPQLLLLCRHRLGLGSIRALARHSVSSCLSPL